MIEIDHLMVSYGDYRALDDISLRIQPGEFVLITGASGCGKSTLARCLNGLVPHSIPAEMTGQVKVGGRSTLESTVAELGNSVGLVFQNPSTQLFGLSVDDEVAFGPRNLGLGGEEISRRVNWALGVTGLANLRSRRVQTLSGGEQQRLAIASVLAMEPRVLVLDEPTSSLDVQGTREILATLGRLNREQGITIVVIEHRLGAVAHWAKRTIILEQGRVVADGKTHEVFGNRDLLRHLGLRRPAEEDLDDWATLLETSPTPLTPPIVQLKHVDVGYGSKMILHGLDLTLYLGEFVALVGSNGTGKSTLAHILAGLIKPSRGQVHLGNGRCLVPGEDVGMLFQNPLHQLFCNTVEEEVSFGTRNLGRAPADVETALGATDLLALRNQPIHALSSGQQQRTALAATLALKPRLIILDEPTVGQDWRHLNQFMQLIAALHQSGCTILLITHDYKLVHRFARRVVVLKDGRIAAEGAPIKNTRRNNEVLYS